MISVIIPTYNRRALLAETLASVAAQTGVECEVIVVDDGSTDDTLAYLATQPVQVISRPHSGVPAVARNAGLARAQGDLIAFLDSDDLWQPTALSELAAALDAAPEAGWAFCDYAYFGEGHDVWTSLPSHCRRSGDLFALLLDGDFLVTGGVLMWRAVADAVGPFDETCVYAEDWDYWLRLAARAPAAYVDRPLVWLRTHAAGLSHTPGGAMYACNQHVTRKAVAYCRAERPALLPQARAAYRRSVWAAARYHFRQRAYGRAARATLRVFDGG